MMMLSEPDPLHHNNMGWLYGTLTKAAVTATIATTVIQRKQLWDSAGILFSPGAGAATNNIYSPI
jgi:hypothetical protein